MIDQLLTLVPEGDRARVRTTIGLLQDEVRRLAGPEQAQRADRLYTMSPATVAVIAPDLDVARLVLLTRWSVWTVLLDDQVDDPAATLADLYLLAGRVDAVATGRERPPPDDRLLVELAELVAELREHDPAGHLVARVVDALHEAVAAGIVHAEHSARHAAGAEAAPTVQQYLTYAAPDVLYRVYALVLLAVVGDAPDGQLLDRWDEALAGASVAVRLANDLSSAERDRAEGRLNVVGLRTDEGEVMTPERVDAWIRALTHRYLATVRTGADGQHCAAADALVSCLRVTVWLYHIGDLR